MSKVVRKESKVFVSIKNAVVAIGTVGPNGIRRLYVRCIFLDETLCVLH